MMHGPVNWTQPINWNHHLNKDLKAWFLTIPTNGGTIFRDLVGGVRGVLTSMDPTTDWVKTDRPGAWGALNFDDTEGNYVDLATNAFLTSGKDFTIAWWEKITADTDAYPARFILDIAGSTDHFDIFRISTDANYRYLSFGSSPANAAEPGQCEGATSPANAVGLWKHFCIAAEDPITTNPANYTVYENGKSLAVTTAGGYGAVTLNRIGYFASGTHGANCQFDDFRVWERRLSPAEVSAYYRLGQQFYPGVMNRRRLRYAGVIAAGGASVTSYYYQHLLAGS